ncbi:MAG TPA: L-glutamate gamma-semialdehyde dehydrogenase, partial [Deltaproteobacteria bacterium]|nr:L-glutamate gamma-semialdehyde dehydrogenase [Deltaproteobacteria bacterium]
MRDGELNARIIQAGKAFFQNIKHETPSLFDKGRWIGKVLDRCMGSEELKTQMFRFVDVFPCLSTGDQLGCHLKEYFGGEGHEIPGVLKWGARSADFGGAIGTALLSKAIRHNLHELAGQFILGENKDEAVKNIARLRQEGYAFVLDILGETTVSEDEAEGYTADYIDLLEGLGKARRSWISLREGAQGLDWGFSPMIAISVKPTALYSQARPQDLEGSVTAILARMRRIYEKVIEVGGSLCIDMESYQFKETTIELFRRLRTAYPDYPHLGIALQSYLRDTDSDLEELIQWSKDRRFPIAIRLVKGAYWDYETIRARQNGWSIPVYMEKAESDAAFERQARKILENCRFCYLACASHNIRSIFAVTEMAKALGVPDECYEFQVLYGMAEPIRKGLLHSAGRIRLYCPYGEMVPGMGYLVRRLLENTSNECFIRLTFAEGVDMERLLQDPAEIMEGEPAARTSASMEQPPKESEGLPPFANQPLADFTRREEREAFGQAIARIRRHEGKTLPLFINGKDTQTDKVITSINPANPSEVLGYVCAAGAEEVEAAIGAAKAAFPLWRDTSAPDRAAYLLKAAAIAHGRMHELSALQILEIGKQWDQAQADVAEAIDFLEYYAREMIRLAVPKRVGRAPGERNEYFYEPKGVAAVVAPWNFPLAISCGMVSAAIVTGNCVVYKPSSLTPLAGHTLVKIFHEAGLPRGVLNFIPGPGGVIGDLLVAHPDISLIAFTGSMDVGLRIVEKAAKMYPRQASIKKVVCEMGGKNAIIVDDDADLDETVPCVLASAFGF